MDDVGKVGYQASVDGFAHQHIVLGILMKKYRNVSLAALPLLKYDIIIGIREEDGTENMIRAQVKTATKSVSFTGGAKLPPLERMIRVQDALDIIKRGVGTRESEIETREIERVISSSSKEGDLIADFFAHSGTTLIAAEKLKRRCFTMDIDPIFAEISIRRLENFRKTGKTGWQFKNPFPEVGGGS